MDIVCEGTEKEKATNTVDREGRFARGSIFESPPGRFFSIVFTSNIEIDGYRMAMVARIRDSAGPTNETLIIKAYSGVEKGLVIVNAISR